MSERIPNKSVRWAEYYQVASKHGSEASYVANLIINHHTKVTLKLKGLARILERGDEVRTASHSIDILLVNGEQMPWSHLEEMGKYRTVQP